MTDTNTIELTSGNVKEATKGIKSADLWQVPYEQLHVLPGFNVRQHDDEYEAHVENLTRLIMANGYDRSKPLAGYVAEIDGASRIVITDGHSRYLAVGRARERGTEIETLPVVTAQRGTSMEDLTVGLVTSSAGRPLTPFETGIVIKRLLAYGWDEKRVADKLGVTAGYVNDLLMLQSSSKVIRDMVSSGRVSSGTAINALKKHGTKASAVLQEAVKTAEKSGKKKATTKHVAPTWDQAAKKHGSDACKLLAQVQGSGTVFAKLPKELIVAINELLSELPEQPKSKEAQA